MQTNIFRITKKKNHCFTYYVFNQAKIVLIDIYRIFIQKNSKISIVYTRI